MDEENQLEQMLKTIDDLPDSLVTTERLIKQIDSQIVANWLAMLDGKRTLTFQEEEILLKRKDLLLGKPTEISTINYDSQVPDPKTDEEWDELFGQLDKNAVNK